MIRTRKSLLDAASVALIPLRPLSIGEILDGALLIVRRNGRSLLGLPLAVTAGLSIMTMAEIFLAGILMDTSPTISGMVANTLLAFAMVLLGGVIGGAVFFWVSGLLARASLMTVMGEEFAPPVKLTFKAALRWVGPMLAMALLTAVALGVAQAAASLLTMVSSLVLILLPPTDDVSAMVSLGLMGVIVVYPFCWASSWFFLAVPVYAAEGPLAADWVGKSRRPTNVVTAFFRSARLVGWKGSFRVALISCSAILLLVIATAVGLLGGLVVVLIVVTGVGVSGFFELLEILSMASLPVLLVVVVFVFSIGVPYLSALQTLLYLDLRMRREGLDLALRFPVIPVPEPGLAG